MNSHFILIDVIPGVACANFVFICCFDCRFSATATLDTVGVSPPTADPSVAQQWPIKNLDAKVGKTLATCLIMYTVIHTVFALQCTGTGISFCNKPNV